MNRAEHSPFIRLKTIATFTKRRAAIKHNLREGLPPRHNIDAARSGQNLILCGASDVEAVLAAYQAVLQQHGVVKLRKNAVLLVEALFSLPSFDTPDSEGYFRACTEWLASYYQVPVLSSIVHMDEGKPHCHVLLVPVVGGRMRGSAILGGWEKLRAMREDFLERVAQRFGLASPSALPKLSKADRMALGRRLAADLADRPALLRTSAMREVLARLIAQAPAPMANLVHGPHYLREQWPQRRRG